MGRFDDAAPSAEHGPKAPERTASSRRNKRVLMVARCRVALSSQVVMGTLQRVLDYPQESAELGTSKED